MATLALILIVIVALLHVGFLVMEMFLWETPQIRARFRTSVEQARVTAPLAKNMGLYNGFLAVGLLIGAFASDPMIAQAFVRFFLACVVVAGIYGSITASRRILWVQAVPGALALLAHFLSASVA